MEAKWKLNHSQAEKEDEESEPESSLSLSLSLSTEASDSALHSAAAAVQHTVQPLEQQQQFPLLRLMVRQQQLWILAAVSELLN